MDPLLDVGGLAFGGVGELFPLTVGAGALGLPPDGVEAGSIDEASLELLDGAGALGLPPAGAGVGRLEGVSVLLFGSGGIGSLPSGGGPVALDAVGELGSPPAGVGAGALVLLPAGAGAVSVEGASVLLN